MFLAHIAKVKGLKLSATGQTQLTVIGKMSSTGTLHSNVRVRSIIPTILLPFFRRLQKDKHQPQTLYQKNTLSFFLYDFPGFFPISLSFTFNYRFLYTCIYIIYKFIAVSFGRYPTWISTFDNIILSRLDNIK